MSHVPFRVIHALCVCREEWLPCYVQGRIGELGDALLLFTESASCDTREQMPLGDLIANLSATDLRGMITRGDVVLHAYM